MEEAVERSGAFEEGAGRAPSVRARLVFQGILIAVGAAALAASGWSLGGFLVLLAYAGYGVLGVLVPQSAFLSPGFFICGDVLFVTLVLHFTGGLSSLAFLGYPIVVVFAALWLGTLELTVATALSLLYFTSYGAVASARAVLPGEPARGLADVLARCGVVALAAGSALALRIFIDAVAERREMSKPAEPEEQAGPEGAAGGAVEEERERLEADERVALSEVDRLLEAGAPAPDQPQVSASSRESDDLASFDLGKLLGNIEEAEETPEEAAAETPSEEGPDLGAGVASATEGTGESEAETLAQEAADAAARLAELERELEAGRRMLADIEKRYEQLRSALGMEVGSAPPAGEGGEERSAEGGDAGSQRMRGAAEEETGGGGIGEG